MIVSLWILEHLHNHSRPPDKEVMTLRNYNFTHPRIGNAIERIGMALVKNFFFQWRFPYNEVYGGKLLAEYECVCRLASHSALS